MDILEAVKMHHEMLIAAQPTIIGPAGLHVLLELAKQIDRECTDEDQSLVHELADTLMNVVASHAIVWREGARN